MSHLLFIYLWQNKSRVYLNNSDPVSDDKD